MKNNKLGIRIITGVMALLFVIILLNFWIHVDRTNTFNKQQHFLNSSETSDDIELVNRISGTWNKEDALVPGVTNGSTVDYVVKNKRDFDLAYWTMRIDIAQKCYLNQAWNGIVEVHQKNDDGSELTQKLDLHNFSFDTIEIEHSGSTKNDLMITLNPGDFLIYYPSNENAAHEYPLGGTNVETTIGIIFYYDTELELTSFDVEYNFGKSITYGTEFIIFVVLSCVWTFLLIILVIWLIVNGRAMKELNDKEYMLVESLGLITSFIDAKDHYTHGHSARVAEYTRLVAEKLISDKRERNYAYYAAILHDIGKCYVPDSILKKPGKLTPEEYEEMKKHAIYGADMLKDIKSIKFIQDGAHYHHERWDGKGYPEGLAGEDIPIIGRIIGVTDSFDVMTSTRCYKDALTKEKAISELIANKGKQFDPVVVDVLIELINNKKITLEGWD